MVSQKKYCDAKKYYQEYGKCNADADVSTEIAMCERLCKINVMEGVEVETVSTTEQNSPPLTKQDIISLKNGNDIQAIVLEVGETEVAYKKIDNTNGPTHTLKKSEIFMIWYANGSNDVFSEVATPALAETKQQTNVNQQINSYNSNVSTTDRYNPPPTVIPSDNRIVKPVPSVSTSEKFRLGLNGGLLYPIGKEKEAKTYLFFGGGISGEYLIMPNIGVGLSASFYGYQVKKEGAKFTASLIPVTLTGKYYYFLTESLQPYGGVDVGLYTIGWKAKEQGLSVSDSKPCFGLAPVVGLQYKLSNSLALDVNAKYSLTFPGEFLAPVILGLTTDNLGFNVGMVYTFGK